MALEVAKASVSESSRRNPMRLSVELSSGQSVVKISTVQKLRNFCMLPLQGSPMQSSVALLGTMQLLIRCI